MQRRPFRCGKFLLDRQQIEAVVACEDAQLVLASAGSGKTLSLLAKIEYLHRVLRIPAQDILVISFTKKTVAELKARCAVSGVQICTFHSLGYAILRHIRSPTLGQKELVSDQETACVLNSAFARLCSSDSAFRRDLADFLLLYDDFVHGKQGQFIANWLNMHGVAFRARQQYPHIKQRYLVDFVCDDIYIDLLNVDAHGRSPQGREYLRDVRWRRHIHARYQTKYITLRIGDFDNDTLYVALRQQLEHYGKVTRRVLDETMFESSNFSANTTTTSSPQHPPSVSVINLLLSRLSTFLSLHKNAQYSTAEVIQRARQGNAFMQHRADLFLKIYQKIKQAYDNHLFSQRKYDFADMINLAAVSIREVADCANHFKYILVDEVQDLSRNRQRLIQAILQKNPHCKLFAVGDDWQSIYRFTGSDLTLVHDFAETFQSTTRKSFIESTHRFGEPTIRLSCDFIRKNPLQTPKTVRGDPGQRTPIYYIFNRGKHKHDDTESLNLILCAIIKAHSYAVVRRKEFQIISRFNRDLERLTPSEHLRIQWHPDSETADIYWRNARAPTEMLKLEFCTMHKAKGITRDFVIVLNMNDDIMGMPAQRESDPLIDSLLARNDAYPFAEERRLFYVAITRARIATYLIANLKRPSPFLLEISEQSRLDSL